MKHSELLERAQAHYKATVPLKLEIPEWLDEDGNPSVVFVRPMTAADIDALARYKDKKEYDARLLVRKARDSEGNAAFEDVDAMALARSAAAGIIGRLAVRILTYAGSDSDNPKN